MGHVIVNGDDVDAGPAKRLQHRLQLGFQRRKVAGTMLDNLPVLDNNYLNALARFLNPGTPGDAGTSLIVDGMEARNIGVTASAVQEIRINNNPYTVEYPRWSRRRIEVITKSSADTYHGTFEVDPDFWTGRISGLAAWRMERSHAENAKDVPAESEGEGGGGGDPGRADGRRDRQGL